MLYHNVHVFARSLRFVDSAALAATAAAVWWIGIGHGLWDTTSWPRLVVFAGWMAGAFFVISGWARTYHARRTEHLPAELISLAGVTICATGIGVLMVEVMTPGFPGLLYGLTVVAAGSVLIAFRVVLRVFLRSIRRAGKDSRTWLVIGRNKRAAEVASEVLSNPHYGIRISRVVDLPPRGGVAPDHPHEWFDSAPLSSIPQVELASVEDIREVMASDVFDEVVITLPIRSFYDDIDRIMHLCTEAGLSVKFPPQAFDRANTKTEVSPVGTIPMVTHFNGPANFFSLTMKRLLDFVVATCALIVLLPLFIVIGIAIKTTSAGPIFFRQQRIGLHGRMFDMVKFRTMVVNAPELHATLAEQNEAPWPAFKIRNDPRMTPIGRFLRKYHLDELPQLWNVFTGEMSLVGPRPIPLYAVDQKEWWHRRRHSVPPGLTCLWQIHDDCKQIPFKKWMELDLEYIDTWSIWLDIRVLFSTIRTVIRGGGW